MAADILTALHDSWLGVEMRDIPWAFPACETLHFIGLSVLFGAVLMMDLRILGVGRRIPYGAVLKLVPFAMLGLGINIATGLCFFCFDPNMYWPNYAFRLKMVLVVVGAANALWFMFVEHSKVCALSADTPCTRATRVVAVMSLAVWCVVLILGRLLPQFEATT